MGAGGSTIRLYIGCGGYVETWYGFFCAVCVVVCPVVALYGFMAHGEMDTLAN
jgi:hypothetical protein